MRRHDGVLCDKRRKELQDFPRGRHPAGSEIEYGEPAVRSLFHNSGISNYIFLIPGDTVGYRNHLAAEFWGVSAEGDSRRFLQAFDKFEFLRSGKKLNQPSD